MQGAVSSDFVFLDGRDFPQQWKGSECLLSVPKNHSFRVRTQLLHSSHSKPHTVIPSLAMHSHPTTLALVCIAWNECLFLPTGQTLFLKKMYFC